MSYSIKLRFESGGEPPIVYIVDDRGRAVLEVFDEPTLKSYEVLDDGGYQETVERDWSHDEKDWELGLFTQQLLRLLNAYGSSG